MIKSSNKGLTAVDYQTLYYILSMNGILTAKDFITFYNRHNDKKKVLEIYRTMLCPLVDREIIVPLRNTDTYLDANIPNFEFEINKSMYERDPKKIKKLIIK